MSKLKVGDKVKILGSFEIALVSNAYRGEAATIIRIHSKDDDVFDERYYNIALDKDSSNVFNLKANEFKKITEQLQFDFMKEI